MLAYIIRRLLLIVPTLLGIMIVNFIVVQAAPGGPVQQLIAQIQGTAVEATARFGAGEQSDVGRDTATRAIGESGSASKYRGAQGLDPEFIKDLERQFGFDKPMHERLGSPRIPASARALDGGLVRSVPAHADRRLPSHTQGCDSSCCRVDAIDHRSVDSCRRNQIPRRNATEKLSIGKSCAKHSLV